MRYYTFVYIFLILQSCSFNKKHNINDSVILDSLKKNIHIDTIGYKLINTLPIYATTKVRGNS